MKIVDLPQGSPEWLAHRRTVRNASDAPAMMGASPYVTRAQLVRQYATGIEREIDAATQRVFDRGHEVEPLLRQYAEGIIADDLYPVTAVSDDGRLGASFDGVTMDERWILEAKQWNADKAASIDSGVIPPADLWQIVQQFAVCESAETCMYLVGDGSQEGTRRLEIDREEVEPLIAQLLAGWEQFDKDVAAYTPEPEAAPAPVGKAPETLPALHVAVTGMVTASNLADFKAQALAVLGSINRDLQTDDDFANAEQTVKWCKGVEDRLAATKDAVLAQTADIEAVFRTMDDVSAETRRIRLELDRLVKARKDEIRTQIVMDAKRAYEAHVADAKEDAGAWQALPPPDFAGAIKGKRTLSSMRDAVDAALAQGKIAASESARKIRVALSALDEAAAGHEHLFRDRLDFIGKPVDDIRTIAAARIAEHERAQAAKLEAERERIRAEEAARLEREAAAKAEAERRKQQSNVSERASEPAQQLPAAGGGRGDYTGELRAAGEPGRTIAKPPTSSGGTMKLGDINARIAPLSISAEGLATFGFVPVAHDRGAKLYDASRFPAMCEALIGVLEQANQRRAA